MTASSRSRPRRISFRSCERADLSRTSLPNPFWRSGTASSGHGSLRSQRPGDAEQTPSIELLSIQARAGAVEVTAHHNMLDDELQPRSRPAMSRRATIARALRRLCRHLLAGPSTSTSWRSSWDCSRPTATCTGTVKASASRTTTRMLRIRALDAVVAVYSWVARSEWTGTSGWDESDSVGARQPHRGRRRRSVAARAAIHRDPPTSRFRRSS